MPRKKTPLEPIEVPRPGEEPEIYPSEDPEVQIPPEENLILSRMKILSKHRLMRFRHQVKAHRPQVTK